MLTRDWFSSLTRGVVCALAALFLTSFASLATADEEHDHDFHVIFGDASPGIASPAVVTTNETDVDTVFSQGTFGTTPIDIRFNAPVELVRPDLTNINLGSQVSTLFSLSPVGPPTINLFYVDDLDGCGSHNNVNGIAGCANQPGNDIVVESQDATRSYGAELIAHEIGHNYGLGHVGTNSDNTNLMNPTLRGNKHLEPWQVNIILNSSLVQTDSQTGELFTSVTPILVVATATVPEPAGMLLCMIGAVGISLRRRSKQTL